VLAGGGSLGAVQVGMLAELTAAGSGPRISQAGPSGYPAVPAANGRDVEAARLSSG
jgi:hypothetical protein